MSCCGMGSIDEVVVVVALRAMVRFDWDARLGAVRFDWYV